MIIPDSATLYILDSIASQCPYVGGNAVYFARALYAQFNDSIFYDDIDLCPTHPSDRSLKVNDNHSTSVTQPEYVNVFPNPTNNVVNLVYFAQTSGQVEFELFDQLGNVALRKKLGSMQSYAQYSTDELSSGVYYWRLKDSLRAIKTGKLVIIR